MGTKTGISWTDATWNPTVGCSRVSPGCEHCYAERVAHRFGALKGHKLEGLTTPDGRWNGKVRLEERALLQPMTWRAPRKVFVDSMSDLFHESLEKPEIDRVFAVMALRRHLTFQILTKRAFNMQVYLSNQDTPRLVWEAARVLFPGNSLAPQWPLPNVWVGVSVEDQKRADERVPILLQTPAAVRFLSVEPLLGPVVLADACNDFLNDPGGLDWVIIGGESGPGARPCDLRWIRNLMNACAEAEVACWVKQLGRGARSTPIMGRGFRHGEGAERFVVKDPKGSDPEEWPNDLRTQEFPRRERTKS